MFRKGDKLKKVSGFNELLNFVMNAAASYMYVTIYTCMYVSWIHCMVVSIPKVHMSMIKQVSGIHFVKCFFCEADDKTFLTPLYMYFFCLLRGMIE